MSDCPPPRAQTALSLREIIERIQSDPSFPKHRRSGVLSSLRCLGQWMGRHDAIARQPGPADAALSLDEITRLIRSLAPAALGVTLKRLQNAASDLRFAFRFCEPTLQHRAEPTEAVRAIEESATDRFTRITLTPLMQYLAATGTDPWCMSSADAEAFREAVLDNPSYPWPRRTARRAINAWNREAARNPRWPQITLSLPDTRSRWGRPWSVFPPSLEQAVTKFLSPAQDDDDLFGLARAQLAPPTVRAQKDLLRLAASALADAGVDPASMTGLRDLCTPTAFRCALGQIARVKGPATSTVQNVAHVLRKAAKLSGVLIAEEVAEVEEAHKNLRRRFKDRAFPRMDRDQHVLDQLDDARLVDALLGLARRSVARVRRTGRLDRRAAIKVQEALALDLLLCAPLRIKNLVALNLQEHFFHLTSHGKQRTVIRIAGEDTKTGEPSEHLLFLDTAELLRLYVDEYRPLISAEPGDWLFPGPNGHHKTENTLGTRQRSHLPLGDWPEFDREAFQVALEPGGLFEPGGLAVRWREHTVLWAIKGYGHWLHYLQRTGQLDHRASPAARASRAALAGYVNDIRGRLAPATVAGRVRALGEVLRVIDPRGDLELVRRVVRNTRARLAVRDKRERLVAPSQLYRAGIARMERNRANAGRCQIAAVQYGDGLMMAMLAAKPVRRRNLVGTRIGDHLTKSPSGLYEWRFAAHETKTRQAIVADLPPSLTPYIDYWLETARPVLLCEGRCNAMWLTTNATHMASITAYNRFCRATSEELGVRINPHLVRDIAATGIAIAMPEAASIIPMVLDHRSDQTSRRHYNLAGSLSASARYVDRLEKLRRRAIRK